MFSRTNTQDTSTDDERPDAEMCFLKQRTADHTVGYCKVDIHMKDGILFMCMTFTLATLLLPKDASILTSFWAFCFGSLNAHVSSNSKK